MSFQSFSFGNAGLGSCAFSSMRQKETFADDNKLSVSSMGTVQEYTTLNNLDRRNLLEVTRTCYFGQKKEQHRFHLRVNKSTIKVPAKAELWSRHDGMKSCHYEYSKVMDASTYEAMHEDPALPAQVYFDVMSKQTLYPPFR